MNNNNELCSYPNRMELLRIVIIMFGSILRKDFQANRLEGEVMYAGSRVI